MGHAGSKIRSLGQFLDSACVHSRRHSFDPIFMKFVRMLIFIKSRPELKIGHVGSKTRSLGQILEKPCVHSRVHTFEPIFIKLCQNVHL